MASEIQTREDVGSPNTIKGNTSSATYPPVAQDQTPTSSEKQLPTLSPPPSPTLSSSSSRSFANAFADAQSQASSNSNLVESRSLTYDPFRPVPHLYTTPLSPLGFKTAVDVAHQHDEERSIIPKHYSTKELIRSKNNKGTAENKGTLVNINRWKLFYHEIALLSGVSVLSFFSFLYTALPPAALASLCTTVASFVALFFATYSRFFAEWQRLLDHRGIGDYLPAGLYQILTQQSFHEFMTTSNSNNKDKSEEPKRNGNMGWLLYFLPGLKPDEILRFVERMPPSHRNALLRPGLAQLLPFDPNFVMTVLMGRERWQPASQFSSLRNQEQQLRLNDQSDLQNTQSAITEVFVETNQNVFSEGSMDDLNNDTGSQQEASRSLEEKSLVSPTTIRARELLAGRTTKNGRVQEVHETVSDEEEEEEINVLMEAFWSAFNVTLFPWYRTILNSAYSIARPTVDGTLIFGSALSIFSGFLAWWGYNEQNWRSVGFQLSRQSYPSSLLTSVTNSIGNHLVKLPPPSNRTIAVTALLGGTTAGAAFYLRYYWLPPTPPVPKRPRSTLLTNHNALTTASWKKETSATC